MSGNPFGEKPVELALGGFKSIRVFRAVPGKLTPVTFRGTIDYLEANHVYEFTCNKTILSWDLVEKAIRREQSIPDYIPIKVLNVVPDMHGPFCVVHATYHIWLHDDMPYERVQTLFSGASLQQPIPCKRPQVQCTCGFYSFYNYGAALGPGQPYLRMEPGSAYYWGIVENTGGVLHGTLGLRSQKMSILGISPLLLGATSIVNYDIYETLVDKFPVFTTLPALYRSFRLDRIDL